MRGTDDQAARQEWLLTHGPDPSGTAVRGGVGPPATETSPDGSATEAGDVVRPKDAPHLGPDWVPLGPTAAYGGMASDRPAITGRVRSISLAPGGERGYASTAGGGVWMTLDTGETWVPLDPWRDTPNASLVSFAGGLAIGALGVRFGNTVDDDVLFVGLGEPRVTVGTVVRRFGRAVAGAGSRVWSVEGSNVGRFFAYRVLTPPPTTAGSQDRAWLVSSSGLHERPAAAPFASWAPIALPAPYSTPLIAGGQPPHVTDVVLLPDGATEWLYLAVQGRGVCRIQLAAGSAVGQPVTPCLGIRESMTAVDLAAVDRISLAAAEDGDRRVYALVHVARGNQRARLFRLAHSAANRTFARVQGVPNSLWVVNGNDQGDYDNTVAVVPQARPAPASATDEVVVAGSTQNLDGDWQASIRRGRVRRVAGVWQLTATSIGRGAHADVHCAVFNRFADRTQDQDDLWIGTDGGIYRAQPSVESGRFQARHGGIAAVQLNFLAQHPSTPAFLIAGSQDNGMLIATGEPTWRRHTWAGDAGGVAVDPTTPRWMWQYARGSLYASRPPGTASPPPAVAFPPTASAVKRTAESNRVPFYTRLASVSVPPALVGGASTSRVAVASHRIWLSNDWGATWRTTPSGINPLTGNAVTRDQLDGQSVSALDWASPSVLYAVTGMGVYQVSGIGAAVVTAVLARQAGTANVGFRRAGEAVNAVPPAFQTTIAVPAANVGPLPPDFAPVAVGAEDATRVYVGLTSITSPEPVWYFSPAGWTSCALFTYLGGSTRVHALLVDPAHPREVYVGTDVGVYRGTRTNPAPPAQPAWHWEDFSFGLPEASVSDLALWSPPGSPVRLLRASTYGRGAWEIDLERATGRDARAPREPEIFLRVSGTDDGRRIPGVTRLPDPLDPTLPTAAPPPRPTGFVESPDIAVVRARARVAPPWPAGALTGPDRRAWRIAAATWGHRRPPGTGAWTAADRQAWQAIQRERLIPVTVNLNQRTWEATVKGLDHDPAHVRYLERYGREVVPPGPAVPAGTLAVPRWQVVDPAPGVNRVLVHVRLRGPDSVVPGRTEVVVLWTVVAPVTPIPGLAPAPALPSPGVVLPVLPARWREGVRTRNLGLLAGSGWTVAGGGFTSTDLGALFPPVLAPEDPVVVGVDLVLPGAAVNDLIALFVVVRCQDDLLPGPADPAATDPLRDVPTVVTTENRTALRVVQVLDPTT